MYSREPESRWSGCGYPGRQRPKPTALTPSRTAQGSHAVTVIDTHVTVQRDPAGLAPSEAASDLDSALQDGATPQGSPVLQGGVGAKERILVTANRLFYHEGIRAVGVDRLISES